MCFPGFFSSQTCPLWGSSSSSVIFQDFHPAHRFPSQFPLVDTNKRWFPVCLSVSGAVTYSVSSPNLDPRRIVDFLSLFAFFFSLGRSHGSSLLLCENGTGDLCILFVLLTWQDIKDFFFFCNVHKGYQYVVSLILYQFFASLVFRKYLGRVGLIYSLNV